MTDKKLTDNDIVKALEKLYNTSITATATDFEVLNAKGLRRFGFFIKEVIDLINRLQTENENLSRNNRTMTSDILKLHKALEQAKAENERLQSILLSFTSEVEIWSNKKGYDTTELSLIAILDEATNIKAEIKSEARKEFAERLKEKPCADKDVQYLFELRIDNLLKEMERANND